MIDNQMMRVRSAEGDWTAAWQGLQLSVLLLTSMVGSSSGLKR
jgi:hypothetical protein